MADEIKILFEDNHILVIEKPVNVLSQKDCTGDEDLCDMLKKYLKEKYDKPGNVYIGNVHRLDRPVGGVMVFAKTSKAASRLSQAIKAGEFRKEYLAVTEGEIKEKKGTLVHYLIKNGHRNKVTASEKETPGSKKAVLDYDVLENKAGMALVLIRLHTGRPHQIRVQMQSIGHPLVGDRKYGKRGDPEDTPALWSFRLGLSHPTTKEDLTFSCLPPEVFPWSGFSMEQLVG